MPKLSCGLYRSYSVTANQNRCSATAWFSHSVIELGTLISCYGEGWVLRESSARAKSKRFFVQRYGWDVIAFVRVI